MRRALAVLAVLVGGGIMVGIIATARPRRDQSLRAEALPQVISKLTQVAQPKLPSGEGDWLTEHPEDGQSIAQHQVDCKPVVGRTVYLIVTSELEGDEAARTVVDQLAPLLSAHFQLPVKRLPAMSAEVAGKSERQRDFGVQWLTTDILEALEQQRPADAAAVMAITTVDLYPDPSWNFVFGQASYDERVGVMSLARSGDFETEKTLVMERTYTTAMHEIGHMFQLQHCVAWECPMNGSNHRDEADSRPLEPCPHCLAKLMLATGLDPKKRWTELRAAFEAAGLTRGVKEIDRELAAK